jgi:ABC-type Na+ efflux pump permease subunit
MPRIWTLAMSTVTQLVRMRILFFLLVFCFLVVGAGFAFSTVAQEQQMNLLKNVSFGALRFFASVIAIVATALLLPKDMEDRTLYTILAKPVPRVEYLLGKLLGVLVVIGCGLVAMDAMFSLVLWVRQGMALQDMLAGLHQMQGAAPSAEDVAKVTDSVARQGLTWSLHTATWAIFCQAAVLAGITLLISCIASSMLFTVLTSMCFAIMGLGQGMLRDYFLSGGASVWDRGAAALLAVVCPDLGLFDPVVNAVVSGTRVTAADVGVMTGFAALYVAGYMVVAHLVFVEKEL